MAKQLTLFDIPSSKPAKNTEENKQEVQETKEEERRRVTRREWLPPAEEGKLYYLLQVDYDGKKGKAVCKLYDENTQKIYVLYDNTGHKSYFLVDLEPDKISKIPKIIRDPSFDHIETVTKID
ncbi:DNA polymerase I, partial [Sulfolobus sp. E1]